MKAAAIVGNGALAKELSAASGLPLVSLLAGDDYASFTDIAVVHSLNASVEACIATIRSAAASHCAAIVWIVGPHIPALERALIMASIEPLAIELAPTMRLCAVEATPGAAAAQIWASARFLFSATSTTGQLLQVGQASS